MYRVIGKVSDEPLVDRSQVLEQRPTRNEEQVEPRCIAALVERHWIKGHFEELFRLNYKVFDAISDAGNFRVMPSEEHIPKAELCGVDGRHDDFLI